MSHVLLVLLEGARSARRRCELDKGLALGPPLVVQHDEHPVRLDLQALEAGVRKNPGFFIKKTSPAGFLVFFWFFLYNCLEESF
jgi:hypothetical protein